MLSSRTVNRCSAAGVAAADLFFLFLEIFVNLLNVFDHSYLEGFSTTEIQIHSQIVVYFSTVNRHSVTVYFLKMLDAFRYLIAIHVRYLEVVNMSWYCHLLAIYHLVGNTWIIFIWIHSEPI